MPCYKRHQQRAACSGKRDPAAYVKKNDLATPTGVDRDYNYLKGVERTIEHANRIASQQGLGVETPAEKRRAAARHPNSALSRYLERNSITIEHAPIGMSRQKSNNTRTTKGGNIHWTVEWVDAQGERCIKDDCLESAALTELHAVMQNAREKEERRQLEVRRAAQAQAKRQGLKRKREQNPLASQRQLDETAIKQEVEFLKNVRSDDAPSTVNPDITEHPAGSSSPVRIVTEALGLQESTTTQAASQKPESSSYPDTQSSSKLYFYLLKPTTGTTSRVLIPLKPEATLTESLQNQALLEYPTIYALPMPPEALVEHFTLEVDYMESIAKNQKARIDGSNKQGDGSRISAGEPQDHELENGAPLDAKSILAMLKRDIAL